MNNLLVALYCRVSTDDQHCQLQLDEMRSYCERRGWKIYAEYVDTISGAKASRPQFNRLMKDARAHRFDVVLCWKLDRFGRSVSNFVQHLEQLESFGVAFMCTSQAIDTSHTNPTSKLLMHILAAVAEFERAMISERVAAGIRAAKKRGAVFGRRRIVIDRQKVRELKLRGKTHRQICAELGLSMGSIIRALGSAA